MLNYTDFDLKIEKSVDGYLARVLRSSSGEAAHAFMLPFSEERLELLVLKLGRARGDTRAVRTQELDVARELGGKLFEAVFAGELLACLRSSLDEAQRQDGVGLRLKLRLQEVPELADLPWEYLYDASLNRFLVQSNQTPLVRYIEMPERIKPLRLERPLRLLVMISSPTDHAALDVERERTLLLQALEPLRAAGRIEIDWLEQATLQGLQRQLRTASYHVFHFIGHGGFDPQSKEGVLVLEDEQHRGWLAGAHRIGTLLHDHRALRLAVLNACEGARNSRTDPFAGVATSLIRQGVPAVVAMQFEITDTAAITFAGEFYAAIAAGLPVDMAVAEARKAIYAQPNDIEWGTPVLYTRAPDGVLFEVSEAESTSVGAVRPVESRAVPLSPPTTVVPTPPPVVPPPASAIKNPALAALVSFLLPGIGQVYLGQRNKGWILFGICVGLNLLSAGGMWVLSGPFAAVDAYLIGVRMQEGRPVGLKDYFWTK